MEARIFKENGDYVVYAEIISPDGYTTFKPLRNFGCRQSDAIEYRDSDLKDVTEPRLNMLIRTYNPKVKYKQCVLQRVHARWWNYPRKREHNYKRNFKTRCRA